MEKLIYRDRRGTQAKKWNQLSATFSRNDLVGLWVADMDFACAGCVREALIEKADFGALGYELTPDSYYDAFIRWERERHGYEVKREWLRYSPGVVAGFNWLISLLAKEGDGVLIQPPVYFPFANAIANQGCRKITNELINRNGVYGIDIDDFEYKLKTQNVKVFLLCSPHNPAGRVWKRDELEAMLRLCRQYNISVIADEIHHDFEMPGHKHVPAASIFDDGSVTTLTAPTKTFNMAGLKESIVIIPDEKLRQRYDAMAKKLNVIQGNTFGITAARAAYESGAPWLESVISAVWENYNMLKDRLDKNLPKAVLSPLEGTYLAWIDLSAYVDAENIADRIENECGLAMDYGTWFGGDAGCHVRLNLATSRENIILAADRLQRLAQ